MASEAVRGKVIGIFLREGEVLVHKAYNGDSDEHWFIPPGGGIEFEEISIEALKREILEELNWEINVLSLLGVFESIHTINGRREHEIVFAYLASPADEKMLKQDRIEVIEPDGARQEMTWRHLDVFQEEKNLLYPDGLIERIKDIL